MCKNSKGNYIDVNHFIPHCIIYYVDSVDWVNEPCRLVLDVWSFAHKHSSMSQRH
jgi:hypothetical protein